jgi:hypothetical protein
VNAYAHVQTRHVDLLSDLSDDGKHRESHRDYILSLFLIVPLLALFIIEPQGNITVSYSIELEHLIFFTSHVKLSEKRLEHMHDLFRSN